MQKDQIVDLDGCIADDRWRRQYIRELEPGEAPNAERFHQYHNAGFLDAAVNLTELVPGARIIILTARPVKYRDNTLKWLTSIGLNDPNMILIMRNNDDHRTSLELKCAQVPWLEAHYDVQLKNIVQALDDRDDIVKMYIETYKLPARVVRIGEEPSS